MEPDDPLFRSLREERLMLLAHRGALQTALEQILALAAVSIARPRKNEALLAISSIAKKALAL